MAAENNRAPGLASLLGRLARTTAGAFQNRFELLTLEWQEERSRLADLLVWIVAFIFLGVMAALLLTATVIFLFPEDVRVYVAAGFTVLYIAGTIATGITARTLLRREPFSESVEQVKRDRAWLKSFD